MRSSFAETDRLAPGKPAGDGSGIGGISDGVPGRGENLANAAR